MRASQFYIKTTREAPVEAETISHKYLTRGSFIQQIAAGIFSIMPLGQRSLDKIRTIIREEMNAAGGLEVTMPVVQPRSIWQESGRADTYVPPLAKFLDRREREMVLAPTHEETVSIMGRYGIASYRDMPLILYQIQTKFRDETRSRGGLLRVREFEMKDAYSFDADPAGLDTSYDAMAQAYRNIFSRCGLDAVMVEADSGSIGGKDSAEFALLADSGEDTVLTCDSEECEYGANLEKAEFIKTLNAEEKADEVEKFPTPGLKTIEALAKAEGVSESKTAKAVFYTIDDQVYVVVIRGDYEVNETKVRNLMGGSEPRLATREEVAAAGFVAGSASAVGINSKYVIADESAVENANLLAGANEEGFHLRNVNFGRDWNADHMGDIAAALEGHKCPRCDDGYLKQHRGIEVGHIFKLRTVYSDTMNVKFNDVDGKLQPVFMGCYGIGTGRLLAAAVEANHDDRGMTLPRSIAPFEVVVVAVNMHNNDEVRELAESLYRQLNDVGIETLLDDRVEAPGAKFADADLIGMPVRVVVSPRSIQNGGVEVKHRKAARSDSTIHAADQAISAVQAILNS
ncbi:Proline--tRNA ligase [Geodia barretti]|uniref:proline--tRNA ligase n=1 Tax=Geodia barretti TaxID=519541 RepID=A0AA35WCU4_GEOBA|nr:Proline--tRNA ligase [Geodia barretti]